MPLLAIIYILTFIIFALAAYAVMQIKLAGINVKDFWSFIEANQILDKLYVFANIELFLLSNKLCILWKQKKFSLHLIKFLILFGKMNLKNMMKYSKNIMKLKLIDGCLLLTRRHPFLKPIFDSSSNFQPKFLLIFYLLQDFE